MTDKESSADKVGDHATDDDSPHAHHAPERRWTDVRSTSNPHWLCLRY
jgi:hypothetical protein